MIYVLSGNSEVMNTIYLDNLLNEKKLKSIKIDKNTKDKLSSIKSFISSNNMFGINNIFIARDFDNFKESDKNQLITIMMKNSDLTFYIEGSATSKISKNIKYNKPKPWEEKKWIEYILEISYLLKVSIDRKVAHLFFQTYSNNDYLIYNELKKLKSLCRKIAEEDFLKYINYSKNDETYELIQKIIEESEDKIDFDKFSDIDVAILINHISTFFLDMLKIYESTEKKEFSWNDIKILSTKENIKSKRIADIVGYSFSKDEKKVNFLKKYSYKKAKNILSLLQEYDQLYKRGKISDSVLRIKIISSFS